MTSMVYAEPNNESEEYPAWVWIAGSAGLVLVGLTYTQLQKLRTLFRHDERPPITITEPGTHWHLRRRELLGIPDIWTPSHLPKDELTPSERLIEDSVDFKENREALAEAERSSSSVDLRKSVVVQPLAYYRDGALIADTQKYATLFDNRETIPTASKIDEYREGSVCSSTDPRESSPPLTISEASPITTFKSNEGTFRPTYQSNDRTFKPTHRFKSMLRSASNEHFGHGPELRSRDPCPPGEFTFGRPNQLAVPGPHLQPAQIEGRYDSLWETYLDRWPNQEQTLISASYPRPGSIIEPYVPSSYDERERLIQHYISYTAQAGSSNTPDNTTTGYESRGSSSLSASHPPSADISASNNSPTDDERERLIEHYINYTAQAGPSTTRDNNTTGYETQTITAEAAARMRNSNTKEKLSRYPKPWLKRK